MPGAAWAEPDLVRRLDRALRIARRVVEVLGETGYQDDATPEDGFSPDKPLAETAMLLHAAAACSDASIRAQVDQLAGRVAALAQSHRTACAIALYPTIAFQLAMPHILLTRLGRTDARLDGHSRAERAGPCTGWA